MGRWSFSRVETGLLIVVGLAVCAVGFLVGLHNEDARRNDLGDKALPVVELNGVKRYAPNTTATLHGPGGLARVTINAQGWNATRDYSERKTPGVLRVAVIGDAYVHASDVDVDDGFPHVMEQALNRRGVRAEVYRFGVEGASFGRDRDTQRNAVLPYHPDIVVVLLTHDDFRTKDGGGPARKAGGKTVEPHPFSLVRTEDSLEGVLRQIQQWLDWIRDIRSPLEDAALTDDVTRKLDDLGTVRRDLRATLRDMQTLSDNHGSKLAVAMDGVRDAVYAEDTALASPEGQLNRVAGETTRELGVPFLDLQWTFAADYHAAGKRFEFAADPHWNARGHMIAGEAIADFLVHDTQLLGGDVVTASSR